MVSVFNLNEACKRVWLGNELPMLYGALHIVRLSFGGGIMSDLLNWLSFAGIAVFATSGALLGLRKSMDIVGITFVATVTGVGGGTVRDLLLGATPVAWVTNPRDIAICIVCAVVVSLFNKQLAGRRLQWLLYADAMGLALFAVLGTVTASAAGAHPLVAVLFGAMSASFGGIIRDIMCNDTPVIFERDIYVSAALLSGGVFILLPDMLNFELRVLFGVLAGLVLRLCAIWFSWYFPFPKPIKPTE